MNSHFSKLIKKRNADLYANGNGYINHFKYYEAHFDFIPNRKVIHKVDLKKIRIYILENFNEEISHENYSQTFDFKKEKSLFEDHFIMFKNNMLINLYQNSVYLLFDDSLNEYATDFLTKMVEFKIKPAKKNTTKISLIVKTNYGLDTKDLKLTNPEIDVKLHYNDDFEKVNDSIIENIKKSKTQSLYLFHGQPGTGKSTYIKYLIHQQNKKVIFLPPNMAGNLDSMELTEFLMDNPNCVLVVEDAEDLIMSRDNNYNSRLSFLLNITDGILSESLGIQIIATFNTDLKNIDKALLRKGRLTSIYEFKNLTTEKSNILLQKLNHKFVTDKPMSLADIFNVEVDTNYEVKTKKVVGF
jgi:hypothetical protein